jgi:hypothetical protein
MAAMSGDLNELFKLVSDAKKNSPVAKQTKEIKENIQGGLGDLFSEMAKLKANDPVAQKNKKIEEQVRESVETDLDSLFSELASLKKQKEEIIQEQVKEEHKILTEVVPLPTPIGEVPPSQQITPTLPLADLDKWLASPKITVDNTSENDLSLINKKIKFLEQWIGKIQNAGPGSGAADVITLDHQTTLVTTPAYTVGRRDYYVGINYAGIVNITMPATAKNGRYVIIKDESGRCSKFPIIVHGNVDNDPDGFILRIDNGGIQMIYRDGWRIV